ncbi:group II intron reverse transcriptase/maturase [Candidatus Phytoplasma bonamiae]|uniref:Domain X domain-containing protein n=1 Tax=Candidatus Phytoplasma bonamiae TaxID=2982626 RepID=A0ABT9D653_9MOLU|nr:group II intron reverse transcriptase/maturase ['Bonamia sp.' little leaf phytoplasma]MDO8064286.1 hypothetical protein ['Bonamia sp.' little leaf phytoplasma]
MTEDLGLKVSRRDKTQIVPVTKGCKFLSYLVKINPTRNTTTKKTAKNSLNDKVNILIPRKTVKEYINNYSWEKGEKIVHDQTLVHQKPLEIIRTYKTIIRGIIQYFCIAGNLSQLMYLNYIAEYSCLKILANKWKTSIARV